MHLVEDPGCDEGEIDMGNGICAEASLAPVIAEYVAEIEAENEETPSNGIQARRFQMGSTGTEVGLNSIDNLRTKRRTQRLTLLAAKVQAAQATGAKLRPREFLKMMNSYGELEFLFFVTNIDAYLICTFLPTFKACHNMTFKT